MYLDIEHRIKFEYSDFISESWVELRIEPQSSASQTVHSFILAIGPSTRVFRFEDSSGNAVRHFSIAEYHREIEVHARSVVQTQPIRIKLSEILEPRPTDLGPLLDYLYFSGPITDSANLRAMFESMNLDETLPLGEQVRTIGECVHKQITYKPFVTSYFSTIDEALAHRAGVCQDKAQIMIGLLRIAKIPARYVSGYMFVNSDVSDHSESHAWVEFYSSLHGWIPYDPTGGIQPGEKHVVVATARHYDEIPPNRGVYRGYAQERMTASVKIRSIAAPAFSTFREEIQEIELPVYSEFPGRRMIGAVDEQVEQASQQQQ